MVSLTCSDSTSKSTMQSVLLILLLLHIGLISASPTLSYSDPKEPLQQPAMPGHPLQKKRSRIERLLFYTCVALQKVPLSNYQAWGLLHIQANPAMPVANKSIDDGSGTMAFGSP